jgi:hypothetical protein
MLEKEDKVFASLTKAWDEIPNSAIEDLCTSFQARLNMCLEPNGERLKGGWQRVHEIRRTHAPDESLSAASDIIATTESVTLPPVAHRD